MFFLSLIVEISFPRCYQAPTVTFLLNNFHAVSVPCVLFEHHERTELYCKMSQERRKTTFGLAVLVKSRRDAKYVKVEYRYLNSLSPQATFCFRKNVTKFSTLRINLLLSRHFRFLSNCFDCSWPTLSRVNWFKRFKKYSATLKNSSTLTLKPFRQSTLSIKPKVG